MTTKRTQHSRDNSLRTQHWAKRIVPITTSVDDDNDTDDNSTYDEDTSDDCSYSEAIGRVQPKPIDYTRPIEIVISFGTHQHRLRITQTESIGDLKTRIQQTFGIDKHKQRLLYRSFLLFPDTASLPVHIDDDDVIVVNEINT